MARAHRLARRVGRVDCGARAGRHARQGKWRKDRVRSRRTPDRRTIAEEPRLLRHARLRRSLLVCDRSGIPRCDAERARPLAQRPACFEYPHALRYPADEQRADRTRRHARPRLRCRHQGVHERAIARPFGYAGYLRHGRDRDQPRLRPHTASGFTARRTGLAPAHTRASAARLWDVGRRAAAARRWRAGGDGRPRRRLFARTRDECLAIRTEHRHADRPRRRDRLLALHRQSLP